MQARLKIVSGAFSGHTIGLTRGRFLVGRDRDCQLILDDDFVSRHHCVFILDDWKLRIRDLDSRNGTTLNGTRLGQQEIAVDDGDVISVGSWIAGVEIDENGSTPMKQMPTEQPETEVLGKIRTSFDLFSPHNARHSDGNRGLQSGRSSD